MPELPGHRRMPGLRPGARRAAWNLGRRGREGTAKEAVGEVSYDTEAEVRLHAIVRWAHHAQSGACPTRMALEAIEALAACGLAHSVPNTGTLEAIEKGPGAAETAPAMANYLPTRS
jgi:hypothetical protein